MIAQDRRQELDRLRDGSQNSGTLIAGSRSVGKNGRLRCVLGLIVVLLSVYPAWIHRYDRVNDAVSQVDMGDLFFSGHYGDIVNGAWGPLYAFLLGSWLHLVRPGPQWEYPVIHVLLFGVFLLCIACFDAFLVGLLEFRERHSTDDERSDGSGPALTIIGYVIFTWSALVLVGVQETNPDLIVLAFFLLACACALRIHNRGAGWGVLVALGLAVAGLFLTKPAALPAGALLIVAAASAGSSMRSKLRIFLAAGLLAGLLSLPYVAALSFRAGHLTISESGDYNYAIHVDNVPPRNWHGETPGAGQPLHPTQVLDSPAVFAFATPVPGTYPLAFDPMYWYAGVKAPINWTLQRIAIANDLDALVAMAFGINCGALAGLILLQSFGLRRPRAIHRLLQYWVVWLPAVVSLIPYILIHMEPRYVAGGFSVLMVTGIASARLPVLPQTRQIYAAAAIVVTALFSIPAGPSPVASTIGMWQAVRLRWPQPANVFWGAASALHEAGFPEGTRVATIEFGDQSHILWAKLARDQIVAEIDYFLPPDEDHYPREKGPFVSQYFWDDPPQDREQALVALKAAGAQVLVTAVAPHGQDAAQWKPLADSGYYYRPL